MDRIQSVSAMKNSICPHELPLYLERKISLKMKLFIPWGWSANIVWMQYSMPGCGVIQTSMDKVPRFSERRLTYEIFSNVKAGRCIDCVLQRLCVCMCARWGMIVYMVKRQHSCSRVSVIPDRSFLYTKQPGERQVLNRQEAMLESVLAYRNASCVDDHLSRNDKLKAICALTWK